jgi:hypothetical protein
MEGAESRLWGEVLNSEATSYVGWSLTGLAKPERGGYAIWDTDAGSRAALSWLAAVMTLFGLGGSL